MSNWLTCRRWIQVLLLITVPAWWALWDFQRDQPFIVKAALRLGWTDASLLFLGLPVVAIGTIQLICYSLDRTFADRKWTSTDISRLAFWRTASPTVALLMVATGLEAICKRHLLGVLWLALGGVVAFVGTLRLRLAGGLKLQRVKSGELYKRAFAMAKEMRTPLKRVYVVPAGRGHLTNAYGLSESIAITDNYGKFLNRAELDFVIGHELGHVLGKHGRKGILVMISGFATVALACFFFPAFLTGLRPVFDVAAILGPILIFYFFSRRFEYAADRTSVEFTRDAKAAINALTNLYEFTQAPTRCDPVTELFMTHPSLAHRIAAIGRISSTGPDQPFNSIPLP